MTALVDWAFCAICGTRLATQVGDLKPACPACGWFRATYAQPVVLVLAHNDEAQVLFARRDAWPAGAWALIAGFIEAGETAEVAALRELAEEAQVVGREPRVRRTLVRDDLLLVCVEVAFAGPARAASDVDAVLLSAPDPDLIPEGWEARRFVEEYARGWSDVARASRASTDDGREDEAEIRDQEHLGRPDLPQRVGDRERDAAPEGDARGHAKDVDPAGHAMQSMEWDARSAQPAGRAARATRAGRAAR